MTISGVTGVKAFIVLVIVWIIGIYEEIIPASRLVHSWRIESSPDHGAERVTINFVGRDGGTEITVTHAGIPTEELRTGHRSGWIGCLDGLSEMFSTSNT